MVSRRVARLVTVLLLEIARRTGGWFLGGGRVVCEATAVRMKGGRRRKSICGFSAGVGVDLMVWRKSGAAGSSGYGGWDGRSVAAGIWWREEWEMVV